MNIYIYNVYICIYYYARECNDDDDVFFFFVCSDYPSRCVFVATCSSSCESLNIPPVCRKDGLPSILSFFLVFLPEK